MLVIPITDFEGINVAREENQNEELVLTMLSPEDLLLLFKLIKRGIFDFDGTMISGESHWQAVRRRYLPPRLVKHELLDLSWYLVGEGDYGESPYPQNDAWLRSDRTDNEDVKEASYCTRTVFRWIKAGITAEELREVGISLPIRPGVKELFTYLDQADIITWGIEYIVMEFLDSNDLNARVAGIRLLFDENGVISTIYPKIVVSSVKGQIVRDIIQREGIEPRQILAIGDSIGDLHMMPDGGLNILLLPPGEVNKKLAQARENHLMEMWESGKLTCIVVADTLHPVVNMLSLARGE